MSGTVSNAITPTLQLMFYSFVLAMLISLPLGIISAYRQGTAIDRGANYTMLGFLATPNFVLAVVLVLFLSIGGISVFGTQVGWKILPAARYVPLGEDWFLHFKHLLLPAIEENKKNRTDELMATGAKAIAVACPFCNIMMTDGVKARDKEDEVIVKDVSELLAESLEESTPAS